LKRELAFVSFSEDERHIVRYLLEQLSDDERSEVERRYFKDPAYLEEIEAVEIDLIERYLDGDLSREHAENFESRYLTTPALWAKVHTVQALRTPRAKTRASWAYGLIAATALLAVTIGWSLHRISQLDKARRVAEEQLAKERQKPIPPPVIVATFSLAAGSERALAARQRLAVPRDASVLRLQLALDVTSKATAYHAILRAFDERQVWDWGNVPVRPGRSIDLEVPAAQLKPDDYVLALEPVSAEAPSHASYVFRVTKE
jgi:hypothetical protein